MFIIKYLKSLMYIFISLIIFTLLITILNYFDILKPSIINILELLSIITSIFIGSFYLGKNSNNKGYIEGLKIGGIIVIILFMLSYVGFNNKLNISLLIYYIILLITSVLGSILGINKKKKD